MNLGEKLRKLRQVHGYSQEQLGEVLEVSHQTISKYEQNSINPSLEKIHLMVETFEVTYDELLDDAIKLVLHNEDDEAELVQDEVLEEAEEKEDLEEVTEDEELLEEVVEDEDSQEETVNLEHRISVYSHVTDQVSAYFKFEVGEMTGPKHDWKPEAYLAGVDYSGWFGENKTTLAYYRTKEDADQELHALLEAVSKEEASYDLQYCVPVKRRGLFGVQMDEE